MSLFGRFSPRWENFGQRQRQKHMRTSAMRNFFRKSFRLNLGVTFSKDCIMSIVITDTSLQMKLSAGACEGT